MIDSPPEKFIQQREVASYNSLPITPITACPEKLTSRMSYGHRRQSEHGSGRTQTTWHGGLSPTGAINNAVTERERENSGIHIHITDIWGGRGVYYINSGTRAQDID